MSSRYTKQHYKDVARLLKVHILERDKDAKTRTPIGQSIICLARDFANLFAADNPLVCAVCHQSHPEVPGPVEGGFNRKLFLEACGLEPEQHTISKQILEHKEVPDVR